MRLKKHLDERLDVCKEYLIAREGDGFFRLSEEEKYRNVINFAQVFKNKTEYVTLELGCGKGAWALNSAERNPDKNYVAVEKLSNVIVVACENALKLRYDNVKFLNCRAENLRYFLPQGCAEHIALNFSCPFPKKTYANRRLTSKNFLELYKYLLAENGVITQKTDNKEFFEWSIDSFRQNGFEVSDISYDLPYDAENNVVTEYEEKFRSQHIKINALKARIAK
ncbi:MAG: tRNA (guanosine(46)-N7)-methyltransferase TrmB [Corallococcus sp.]|nr:tRNA (guanosine(46)-N7)-methyltransferase TrmB [Bacillota bacterium]MCM1533680.1 tRNA (guanosine(46)-N7)-methyltransferase TrmB [Corallococcus sp.]